MVRGSQRSAPDMLTFIRRILAVCILLTLWLVGSASAKHRADNKSEVKEWFKSKGLTTGYLMGAAE
jgi:hypothetical protein